jgi:glucokinase
VTFLIGIDLGTTNTKAAAFAPDGALLAKQLRPTGEGREGGGPPAFAEGVRTLIADLERELGGTASGVGLAAPGLAARDERSISHMPGRFGGLEAFDWSAWLGREVPVLNDAHAALLGEIWCGAAKGLRDVMMLTLGTGVGGAFVSDGRLIRGHIGRAGHLGHICLDPGGAPDITRIPGSIEDLIGNHNIATRSGGRFATTHELIAAYRGGDPVASRVWLKSIRELGCAVASLVNVLDPEAVVIGGGIALAGDALFEPLQRVLDEVEWRPAGHSVRLLPAALGDWAGAYGAAWRAAVR